MCSQEFAVPHLVGTKVVGFALLFDPAQLLHMGRLIKLTHGKCRSLHLIQLTRAL